MKSNGRFLNPIAPDFRVEFADGASFTSDEGTWDDVPRDVRIKSIVVAGIATVADFDHYGFEWEAVAQMPVGRTPGASGEGVVVAARLYAMSSGRKEAAFIRVDRKLHGDQAELDANELVAIRPEAFWRGAAPIGVPA